MNPILLTLGCAVFLLAQPVSAAEASKTVPLWPQSAPGEKGNIGEEADLTKPTENLVGGKRLIRLGNVSKPDLQLFRPPADKDTGASVLVCPGGGYHILALDLEGTEVCEWLNSIGVTGILLKYRVPKREGMENHGAALQDAQRAMGLLRLNAKEWGLDPNRIGVLGFSAGGHLSAALSNTGKDRTYSKLDAADELDCRPNFAVLIYPAYLATPDKWDKPGPGINVTKETPPTFITITQDDPVKVENALYYSIRLKEAGVPFELHLYPKGGHGYGLRRTELPVTTWPDRAADWMRAQGWLKK